jgi:ornithine decarboxylase
VYDEWTDALPDIKPYYAVKCNPEPRILEKLAHLGSNFDCASPAEIQLVLDLGVEPERILYANPCKRVQDIAFAKNRKYCGPRLTACASWQKIARVFEDSLERPELLLRIRADDPHRPGVISV